MDLSPKQNQNQKAPQPLPDFAKDWQRRLAEKFPDWPDYAIESMIRLHLVKPITHEDVERWANTPIPEELRRPPKEGKTVTYNPGDEGYAEIDAMFKETIAQQKSEFLPAIEDGDEIQCGCGESDGCSDHESELPVQE